MRIYGGVPGSSHHSHFVLAASLHVQKLLGKPVVDQVDGLRVVTPNHKVLRLEVSVNESELVQSFNSVDHLFENHEDGFELEFEIAGPE